MRLLAAVATALAVSCVTLGAAAQDVQLPEPTLLQVGARAPFTGQLMAQEDVLSWARTIEGLERQLAAEVTRQADLCAARITGEQARTTAAEGTTALHDALFEQRITALAAEVVETRQAAMRQWYESPALWFGIGVLVAAVVVIVVGVAL